MSQARNGFRCVWLRSMVWLPLAFCSMGLSALHAQEVFYFPHYGDGGGLSMQINLSNSSATPAQGIIEFFNPSGEPATLPDIDETSLELMLGAFETAILHSDGSSDPLQSGYIKASFDSANVTGLAIFKLASGSEASVLPTRLGNRFSLFAQRGAGLETGLAVFRSQPLDILGSLYDGSGVLISSQPLDIEGLQSARTIEELFPGAPEMVGGSVLLSCADEVEECEFAPLGLRFGGDVLSTVAVTDLTQRMPEPDPDPDPDPEEPVDKQQLRRLQEPSSHWSFEFSFGSEPLNNEYAFTQLVDLSTEEDPGFFTLLGVDEFFDLVAAAYVAEADTFILLDPSGSLDLACIYEFVGPNTVDGCCQFLDADTGQPFTSCADMLGLRQQAEVVSSSASAFRWHDSGGLKGVGASGLRHLSPEAQKAVRRLKEQIKR